MYTDKKKETIKKYLKKQKQITLRVPKEHWTSIQMYAAIKGKSVNTFIRELIDKDIEKNGYTYEQLEKIYKDVHIKK